MADTEKEKTGQLRRSRQEQPIPQEAPLPQEQTQREQTAGAAETPIAGAAGEAPELERLPAVGIEEERRQLDEMSEAARAEAEARIDRTVEEGVQQLEQTEAEAQAGFQTRRDQIALDERQAMDSTALYAELRGDRGGIGQAQYASVQNTAAVNRQQVSREQQRLATETAQRIEALRREGEFQKADAVLELTQKHLAALMELERWAQEKNLSVAEFNTELARWEAEYAFQMKRFGVQTELSLASLTGTLPDGTPTYAARQAERAQLAAAAKMLLEYGLTLTPEQLEALGWTEGQYEAFIRGAEPGTPTGSYGGGGNAGTGAEKPERPGKPGIRPVEASEGETEEDAAGEGERTGVPFQLLSSWFAGLESSSDPAAVYAQIRASDWYGRMTPEQEERLQRALRERGLI